MGKVKEQLQETPQATAVAKPKPTLAVVSASNPYLEDAGDGIGTMLKFVKGKWRIGDTTIPIGTQYVAYLPQALKGWGLLQGRQGCRSPSRQDCRPLSNARARRARR